MKIPFFSRYGSVFAIGLLALFSWSMLEADLHESPEFGLLFPLRWVALSPAGPFMQSLLGPFEATQWWIVIEVAVTVIVWMLVYFVIRGAFYSMMTMEGPSLWVTFAALIGLAIACFAFLLWPAFTQINIWWSAWPGEHQPLYP